MVVIGEVVGRVVFLISILAIIVGAIFLQIYLSKKENKLPGLILPIITFVISIMAVMGMATYTQVGQFTHSQYIDGQWISVISEEQSREAIPGAIGSVVYVFVIMNIPTITSLAIYKAVKNKQNSRHDLEKMSVQDL